jgi:hypothetical protein
MYTMTVDEVLDHAQAVVKEAGGTLNLPSLPVINEDVPAEAEMGIELPGEPPMRMAESVSIRHPEPR